MRITEKLLLVFIPTFLLSVVTMTLFSRRAVEEALIQSVVKSGHAMSINLNQSQGMVRSFAMGNESLLLPPLQQMLESTGALYGMILDPDSRVLAHTNVVEKGKVYSDHVTMDAVRSERPQHAILEVDGLKVMDFAFPVWALDRTHTGEEFPTPWQKSSWGPPSSRDDTTGTVTGGESGYGPLQSPIACSGSSPLSTSSQWG